MKSPFLLLAGWLTLGLPCLQATPISVTVPGTANPWLAGAADGTTAASGDVAPTQSPVQVSVTAGDVLRFYVSGTTGYASGTYISPDGDGGSYWELDHAAENGVAGIDNAPASALIGVFLDATAPVAGSEPSALDYVISSGVSAAREAASHSPGLKQPFFIGNGVGAGNGRQTFTVPAGATRLFLGTLDGSGWFDNVGSFAVNITVNASGPTNIVSWSTPTAISAPTDVQTTGSLVLARNVMSAGASANQEVTVNGVTFAEARDITYGGVGDALFELSSGYLWGGSHGSSSTPFADLDTDYQTLLNTASFRLGAVTPLRNFQLTLNSLTIGDTYHVQLWVNGSNELAGHTFGANNYRTVVATPSGSVALDPNSTNAEGGVGQWVTGTFVTNEPGITFEFTAEDGGTPMLNAFQLRQESATPQIVETELPLPGNSFTVTGGTGPYTFEVVSGALPAGLSLSSSGEISGTLSASSVGGVLIRVTDSLSVVGGKIFTYNYDLGRPEIALKRVVLQDVGGTNRMAIFEVTASDDVALAPFETDSLFTNASHAFEYRFKVGTGAFSAWERALYFPFNYPPAIPFDTASDLRVEFRSIDAAGTPSRTLAYDIKKGALPSADQTFGVSVGSATTLIPNAGTSIIKLFTEETAPGSSSVRVTAVDRDTGKISAVYNSNRTTPANSPKTSLTLSPATTISDAAAGLLLPPTTGKNDGITDFVLCAGGSLKIVVNKSGAAPSLALHPLALPVDGAAQKVAVGDVNADGADDIIAIVHKTTGPSLGHFLAVYLSQATAGSTNGTFTSSGFAAPTYTLIPLVQYPRSLAAGDINGDGAAEVVFGCRSTASSTEQVRVYEGTPGGTLVAPAAPLFVTNPDDDEEIVEVKIADYSGHVLGHKDILVGIIGGPDAYYPSAAHVVKHRVLVAQLDGSFKMAPTRRLATLSSSVTEKDVFNLAVGSLSDRVVPDIISCQFDSISPAGTVDLGFLPPANVAGELNWMLGNDNGVQSFGTLSGKPRRVALADLTGNSLPDVILANADSGNIELQANTKPLLTALPAKVVASPTLSVPLLTNVTPGGAAAFAKRGIANQPWVFSYAIGKAPADAQARVEYQLNGGPWTTLPGGFLAKSGSNFSTTVPSVPLGLLRFRCWATSASQSALGVYDSYSLPSQAIRSIDAQSLVVTVKAEPDSDPTGNTSTHDNEFITYRLSYANTGTAPAQNVVLAAAIPANTTWGNGGSADYVVNNTDPAKVTAISWNLGTLAPGATGSKFFFAQVKSNALAVLKGKSIELKAMSAASLKSPPATAALFISTTATNKTFGIYSSAPVAGFKPQVATGSSVATPVVPPLTLTQVVSASTVNPGSEIDVEIIARNHGTLPMNNIVVEDFIENSFFVKSVRLRNPSGAATGDFTDAQNTQPQVLGSNPLLETRTTGRFLKWNVGTLAGTGFPPSSPPGECRMRYTLVVRYDVNPQDLINDVVAVRQLDYGGLGAKGIVNGVASAARVDVMPRVTTAVQPQMGFTPPAISFTQELVPVTGSISNPGLFTEPSKRRTAWVSGEEMTSVTEGGLLRVKLRYENTGGTTALRSAINYELPGGTEFLGFVRYDEVAVSDPNDYSVYGAAGAQIPTFDGARVKEVRKVMFNLGNLAAASTGVVDFLIAAYDPPLNATGSGDNKTYTSVVKTANEKPVIAGSILRSRAFTMTSDSLSLPAQGSPRQVPIFVARPIAFDTKVTAVNDPFVILTAGSSADLTYRVELKNTGWEEADNVELIIGIPAGTQYISSVAVDPDTGVPTLPNLNGTRQLLNGSPAATDNATQRVRFVFPTVASDYNGGSLGNPAARRAVDITVRVPWPRLATQPKTGVIEMTAQSIGVRTLPTSSGFSLLATAPAPTQQSSLSTAKFSSQLLAPGAMQKITGTTLTPTTGIGTGAYQIATVNTGFYVRKWLPSIIRPGQAFDIVIEMGNCRSTPINNVIAKIQLPYGTDFEATGTSPGFTKSNSPVPNVYVWNVGTLPAGSVNPHPVFRKLRVRVKNKSAYEGNYIDERSLVVTGSFLDSNNVAVPLTRVPDPVRMLVLSNNPAASAWQWFGAMLQGLGSSLFNSPNNNIRSEVSNIGHETMVGTIAGADTLKLTNGATIIQMGGGNIVASGGGNIVASGGGNVVAAGGGNIVASGAGNFISVDGSALTASNIASIVASGGGNIVAGGAGNMIVRDSLGGFQLLANDGAGLTAINVNVAGVVAAGGGNVVASGGGNIVAGGAGNAIGAVMDLNGGNVLVNSGLLANDGGGLLANDGGGLLANDGGGLIANDGAGVAPAGGNIVAGGAGNMITKTNQ